MALCGYIASSARGSRHTLPPFATTEVVILTMTLILLCIAFFARVSMVSLAYSERPSAIGAGVFPRLG